MRFFPKWASQVAQWKIICLQCRRCKRRGFSPWIGKIPWSRKWQQALVRLPGESHGQRSLAGYSPWGPWAVLLDMTEHILPNGSSIYLEVKCSNVSACRKCNTTQELSNQGPQKSSPLIYLLSTTKFNLLGRIC